MPTDRAPIGLKVIAGGSAQPGASREAGSIPTEATVSYSKVTKLYELATNPVSALSEITTDIGKGEFVSILGPSGCGKSTLLRITAGLVKPTSGTVRLNGTPITATRTDIGFVFQYPVLLPWKKVIDNILFQIEMRGMSRKAYLDRAKDLIQLVGLSGFEQRYPAELSGGMQHRVSLCRALIHDPSVLLMDEPFGALDAMTRDQMGVELFKIWERTKKTVVLVTHSISEAVFLSSRVLVMSPRPGKILEDMPIELGAERTEETRDSTAFIGYTRHLRSIVGNASVP